MGRQKEFEESKAIEKAIQVFWAHGFERSHLSTLTKETGLHKGSLYGAFKSKEQLFTLCLHHYSRHMTNQFENSGLSGKAYLRHFFNRKLNFPKERRLKGCMLMNASIERARMGSSSSRKTLHELLKNVEKNLEQAVKAGTEDGSLPDRVSPRKMAERLFALAFTIEELGKIGKPKAFLKNIMNATLKDLEIEL